MRRLFLALFIALFASQAFAIPVIQPRDCKFFNAIAASADHNSNDTAAFGRAFDLSHYRQASFHLVWASLTGSIDATVKMQVSNDGTNWVDKSGATFNLIGANGSDMIVLVGSVAEAYYRLVYAHNSVSGGTLTGYCTAKE